MREDKLRKTEQLLQEAAGWEPQRAAPERLAQRALLAALEQERARPRRPSPLLVLAGLVFGGGAVSAALSGTLLLVLRPAHEAPLAPLATPKATLAGYRSHLPAAPPAGTGTPTGSAPASARPRVRHAAAPQTNPAPRRSRVTLASSTARRRLPRAVWSTQEVEKRETGVIAGGVVVEPDPQTGALYLLPAVVDIPISSSTACGPAPDPLGMPPEPAPDQPAPHEPAPPPAPQSEPLP